MTPADADGERFAQYARLGRDERLAFILAHPALLANAALETVRTTLLVGNMATALSAGEPSAPAGAGETSAAPISDPAAPANVEDEASGALNELLSFRAQLDAGKPFPLGVSPIEAAWEAYLRGEIAFDEAERRAKSPDVISPLAYPYVRAVSAYAVSIAGQRPRDAVNLQALLLAATEGAGENREALVARTRAAMDYITVATPLLVGFPDGRVYRRALAVGAWLEGRPERLTMWPPGELAFRLGVLHLDPYFFGGDVVNYERSYSAWQNRLVQQLGPAAASIPAEDLAMPAPIKAIATAVDLLNRAAATQTGPSVANAEKALTQALLLQTALAGTPRPSHGFSAVLPLGAQRADSGNPVLAIVALSAAVDAGTIDPAEAEHRLLALPAAEALLERAGADRAVQAVLDALQLLVRLGSSQGLAFLEAYRALVAAHGDPDQRRQFWQRELDLFAFDRSAGGAEPRVAGPASGPDPGARAVAAAALVQMVEAAQRENREQDVLDALERFVTASPDFAADHADALQYLRYFMTAGLASNAFAASRWADAIVQYGLALSYCLEVCFEDRILSHAAQIDDLAAREGADVPAACAVVLMACALRFEAALGDTALRLVLSICTKAVTGMLRDGTINTRAWGSLMLAGIATRLGATLRTGAQIRPGDDGVAADLLARIAAIERTVGLQLPVQRDETILLASFVGSTDREGGADPLERLRNLQRAFDTRIDQLMAQRSAERRPDAFTLEQLRAALDDHAVLLQYFLGATPDGRLATNVLLVTKEDVAVTAIAEQFPAGLIGAELESGLKAFMPPLGLVVEERRSQVCTYPGPLRHVDVAGGEGLVSDLRRFLGPFVERLAALRAAGKTRLTIVPYGPLHFYPWALLGGEDHPLADDWAIDMAPALGFLVAPAIAPNPPAKTERSVIGLTFANPNRLGLPSIPGSADEARAVAAALAVTPILDDAATKPALLAALARSRYAHVSTHGRHAVVAPGFQTIFCADDGSDDAGRLFAHEILAQDFRGLEVLTLSACETALGRYDLADNLRGLPAAFFLAGVQTIVATLWPVRAAATATFFPAFYTALEGGGSHYDAFAAALSKTRAAFPQLRDWGAFSLMGRPT